MPSLLSLTVVAAFLMEKGLGAVDFIDPPSGSVIANFEGTVNTATITCNISHNGSQVPTQWNSLRSGSQDLIAIIEGSDLFLISGDPDPQDTRFSLRNRLTILNLTSEVDGTTVFCGTGAQPQLANFTLRLLQAIISRHDPSIFTPSAHAKGPPRLQDNFMVQIEENSRNVSVDIRLDPEPFPLDTISFSWTRNGRPLISGSGLTLTYSSMTFSTIKRSDAGEYSVLVSNYVSDSLSQQIGNDTGSFFLDVLYGPTFVELGPMQRYVLLGDSLSLVCGTGLDSNPQATVTWTAPNAMDNARYVIDNGPDIVRLNITHTILSDTGMWLCEIIVRSERHIVSNGTLALREEAVIGTPIQHKIMVIVIAPPGQPNAIAVDTKPTSVLVGWNPPMADSPITYYSVRACNLNITTAEIGKIVTNTTTNTSAVNVTGLLPGTTYELTVVAVSQGGNIVALSQPSDPVIEATEVTVPALTCDTLVSANGVITVSWSYIHTGGLPLTNVSVSYRYEDGSTISTPIPIPINALDTTDIPVSDLEFGFVYVFNVTARNSNGSSSILCGSTLLKSGSIGNLIGAAVGGIIGGCLLLGIIITLIILLFHFILRRRGTKNINVNNEAVYEDPDSFQQYTPKKDQSIELKECPAYGKPISRQPDIELEECPAYVEKKREISNIELEECPAYVEKRKDLSSISLEECPAYEQLEN